MKSLIRRIRWRLVGWTMLIMGVLLLLLGATIYAAAARSLTNEVDHNLFDASERALPNLFARRPPEREGYRGGIFYVGLLPDDCSFGAGTHRRKRVQPSGTSPPSACTGSPGCNGRRPSHSWHRTP